MIKNDPKKLVRGLKDISALFGAVLEAMPVRSTPEVQVIAVSSPDCEGDSLLLNTFFSSQLVSAGKACSLVSVLSRSTQGSLSAGRGMPEPFGDHLQRYCIYWDELRDVVTAPSLPRTGGILQSRDIFLDFEYRQILHFEKVLGLLDKWVLLLKPTPESLTEGYKMMKVGLAINPQLEFHIALSGKTDAAKGGMIFDRFSDLASRHLDTSLVWLGWMDLADPKLHFSADLQLEPLRYQSWDAKPSLQKFALAGWVESLEARKNVPEIAEAVS